MCVRVCVCVCTYLAVLQFYLMLGLAIIHSDVVEHSHGLPTLWFRTFTATYTYSYKNQTFVTNYTHPEKGTAVLTCLTAGCSDPADFTL